MSDFFNSNAVWTMPLLAPNAVLNVEPVHFKQTKADLERNWDFYWTTPLASPCKKDNTDLKGIQRIIKNLTNKIELLKRYTNVRNLIGLLDNVEVKNETLKIIFEAATDISGFVKNILERVRGWIYNKISDSIKKIAPFLFPGEAVKLFKTTDVALNTISCLFSKITRTLQRTFSELLTGILDKYINAPLCAAENLITDFLDIIMDDLIDNINVALSPIGQGLEVVSDIFQMIEFSIGILDFFRCDDDMMCPIFHEINLAGTTNNAEGGDPANTTEFGGAKSPSDGETTKENCLNQLIPKGQGNGGSSSPTSYQIGNNNGTV